MITPVRSSLVFFLAWIGLNGIELAAHAGAPAASFQLIPGTRSAWAVSGDGSTVIGNTTGPGGGQEFYWRPSTGVTPLEDVDQLLDLSEDGDILVGHDLTGSQGIRRSISAGNLPAPSPVIEVRGVSADGNVLTGSVSSSAGRQAYRWTEATGITPLGDLPGGQFFSYAEAVSGDGSKIVGQGTKENSSQPILWTESAGIRALGDITGEPFDGWAFDISKNGNVVVGLGNKGTGDEAFVWTETGGRVDLGDFPGGAFYSFAHGVSQDGSVVVGLGTDDGGESAFVWTHHLGLRKLRDVLSDYGIETGVRLHSAWDISSDGRTIVGTAIRSDGQFQAFIAVLPIPEPSTLTAACVAASWLLCFRRR
jgi:hypothetical protein